ncbi:MAG: VacJ family lipoprotein [Thermaurantiacus sp.]
MFRTVPGGPAALLLLVLVAGCAHGGARPERATGMERAEADPLEDINRQVFEGGGTLNRFVLDPATGVWKAVVPKAARRGVANAYRNLDEPRNFLNALLQGRVDRAFRALDRMLINTALGVGGLADHATDMGLPEQHHDFGQTLAVWGVESGPFVIAPIIGPSTVRDTAGFIVDFLADPTRLGERALLSRREQFIELGVEIVSRRAEPATPDWSAAAFADAPDPYVAMRTAWIAWRQAQIRNDPKPPVPGRSVEGEGPGHAGLARLMEDQRAPEREPEIGLPAAPEAEDLLVEPGLGADTVQHSSERPAAGTGERPRPE